MTTKRAYVALWTTLLLTLVLSLAACAAPAATPATGGDAVAAPTTAPATEVAAEEPVAETTEPTDTAEGSEGETVTVTHPQGETTVVKNPATVVVFDYSALDTLDQLGIPVAAVPQGTNIPPALSKYAGSEYANAGTLFEPDYELVNDLQPDLIIAGGRSSTVYPDLSEIAPTIDVTVDEANFWENFSASTTNLGIIFDKEEEVATRLAELEASIARVNEKASSSGLTALIVLTSGGEVTAYGPGSRFGMIHEMLGVTPVSADIETETHGDPISFEYILEKNPDIIYVVDRDASIGEAGESAAEILDNELVNATNAAMNGKIVYLTPGAWYLSSSGLGSVQTMIAEVEGSLE